MTSYKIEGATVLDCDGRRLALCANEDTAQRVAAALDFAPQAVIALKVNEQSTRELMETLRYGFAELATDLADGANAETVSAARGKCQGAAARLSAMLADFER